MDRIFIEELVVFFRWDITLPTCLETSRKLLCIIG